jgi:hypothetical protein
MDAIEARDTAKVKNSSSIATVNIDGTAYFKKSEGYIELILNGPVSVGVTRTIYLLHSQSVQVSVKYTPDSGYDPTSARNDVTNFDRKFARQNQYYLIDGSGSVYDPTEATLNRLYPSHKKEINAYIAERHPDLKGEEDLKLMISYLSSLKG